MSRALSIDATGSASGFEYSVLGDVTGGFASVSTGFDPYGDPDNSLVDVGFGYRGELHVGGMVYLRFRDLNPSLSRFTTIDPLSGVPGTTTVANQYAYANNDPIGLADPVGLRAGDGGFDVEPLAPESLVASHANPLPADVILSAMLLNVQSAEARRIRSWNLLDDPGVTCSLACNLFAFFAVELWVDQVRAGGPWDYKRPLLQDVQAGEVYWPLDDRGDLEVFFDVWSNIHYGYVGRAAGFTATELQLGADLGRRFPAFANIAGENDRSDVIAVAIGIELWERHGDTLIFQQLVAAVRLAKPSFEVAAQLDRDENVRVRLR